MSRRVTPPTIAILLVAYQLRLRKSSFVQAYWNKMIENGVKPTPEDVIEYIAKQAKKM
jgi:hypothetical protein